MLTLSILRHAKSSWSDPELDDHDRPLAKRGAKAIPALAKFIRHEKLRPTLALCSDAMRTRATLTLLLAELGPPAPRVVYDEALYLASPEVMRTVLGQYAEDEPHVLLVGHNPGLHALALELAGDGDRKTLAALAQEFPTGALAVLTFKASSWKDITSASGHLEHFTTPRRLES
ncbi:SixA phosphatase family protein [Hyphomicrobium sp. DMF-1]|jgi:phosphohistidine phosphatase|uniref:SixA phosphatase family protein n=1 Tax=Hyphomicrobium sp. DMF-1 TaxID=3019544 RepID=UPI0022EBB54F|nr:histidine phosphatase family protein [Hyphomicrobium sp. DMF-1]WBT39767.1 histidine phosphatase family protein [Hyphomicrobium sp. DMF-1]